MLQLYNMLYYNCYQVKQHLTHNSIILRHFSGFMKVSNISVITKDSNVCYKV